MSLHLQGMWVAFGVAASFIVYFLLRVRRALERHGRELDAARSAALRQERLASLATLAAGAAHELLTPLSTIAVIAGDLQRDLAQPGASPRAVEDARLRCARRSIAAARSSSGCAPTPATPRARGSRPCRSRCWSRTPSGASPIRASACARRSRPRSLIGC